MRIKSLPLSPLGALLGPLALLALVSSPVRAQVSVTLNTGPLNGLGMYFLDFQLLDGNGIGDGNSRVRISGLSLTGGALGATPPPTGGVSGTPETTLSLVDSDPVGVADYQRAFTVTSAASLLTFNVTLLPTAPLDTPIPDTFNFLILQGDGVTPLPTLGPTGAELVASDFFTLAPSLSSYATSRSSPVTLSAPRVGNGSSSVAPEPASGSILAVGAGLLALGGFCRRRGQPKVDAMR